MWKRVNPNVEYVIAAMRKKGENTMGLVKSEAQRKANQLQRKSAIAASDHEIINGPKPTTWSARMPAYAGTSLCPDPKLRGGDTIGEDKDNHETSEQLTEA